MTRLRGAPRGRSAARRSAMRVTGYRPLASVPRVGRPVGNVDGAVAAGVTEVPVLLLETRRGPDRREPRRPHRRFEMSVAEGPAGPRTRPCSPPTSSCAPGRRAGRRRTRRRTRSTRWRQTRASPAGTGAWSPRCGRASWTRAGSSSAPWATASPASGFRRRRQSWTGPASRRDRQGARTTRETVWADTPAAAATSARVTERVADRLRGRRGGGWVTPETISAVTGLPAPPATASGRRCRRSTARTRRWP